MNELTIIGGGLAGSEAAWQAANRGIKVLLYEMRPARLTPAHKTGLFGELVCSNSLKNNSLTTAHGLIKEELEICNSLIMEAARETSIPGGMALTVDREKFASYITSKLTSHPLINTVCDEVTDFPDTLAIMATGPLTSESLSRRLSNVIGTNSLFFYDAIAPILDSESIDYNKAFFASRYGKGGDDYLNCPMDKEAYDNFYDALIAADTVHAREFEDVKFFEGCMPVEVMAGRGRDTLRFGPLKPVGLVDPHTGKEAYATLQLRSENASKSAYNMVGFQTRLKYPDQKRVFTLIPGLENAEFLRYGSIHRNTYVHSPTALNPDLSLKGLPNVYLGGQITGVEGYLESTAMGLVAGVNAARRLMELDIVTPPPETAHGALLRYVTTPATSSFQPSNINFALLPTSHIKQKDKRREAIVERALSAIAQYADRVR